MSEEEKQLNEAVVLLKKFYILTKALFFMLGLVITLWIAQAFISGYFNAKQVAQLKEQIYNCKATGGKND